MRIETYRRAPFVDREDEEKFLVEWFSEVPQKILWVYGPKSSGKTTVISYVVDNYLVKDKRFWVKYFNLRRLIINSYESFLDSFFISSEKGESERVGKIEINVFGFKAEVWKKIKNRELNLFKMFIDELEKINKKGKKCVLIVDEIQKLRDVYIKNSNGERELLKEFLNLCVSLTKELHLSHVVILTSNTVFIERIYNDARMKETSRFKKIDHLDKEQVFKWLQKEGFTKNEIELVWEYYGGNISRLLEAIKVKRKGEDLKEFLKHEAWLAYAEIVDYLTEFNDDEVEFFRNVA